MDISKTPVRLKDRRCFLWRVDGSSAGIVILPEDATQYPPGIKIFQWDIIGFYRQRPSSADQYDEFIPIPGQ